jgi:hypothetical protein
MQQAEEQYPAPQRLSREPTQWTNATRLGGQTLELESGEDVVIDPEAILALEAGVERREAWGEQ